MSGPVALPFICKIPSQGGVRRSIFSTARMSTTSASASAKTVNVRVKGVVQGVFYRKWTADNAKELGLKGWVRNRRDGTVEAVFSGDPQVVDNMLERCKSGPPDAVVTGLESSPSQETVGEAFELKPTC